MWVQVAFLHKATGALIAGDVFTNIFGEPPALALAPNGERFLSYRVAPVPRKRAGMEKILHCREQEQAVCCLKNLRRCAAHKA